MTAFDFVAAHPGWAFLYLAVVCATVVFSVEAVANAMARWKAKP